LQRFPRSGRKYPDDSPFSGSRYTLLVVRARPWAYRVTYDVRGDTIWVRYLYPSWYPLTHPDLVVKPGQPG
jgi:hypothetical protein